MNENLFSGGHYSQHLTRYIMKFKGKSYLRPTILAKLLSSKATSTCIQSVKLTYLHCRLNLWNPVLGDKRQEGGDSPKPPPKPEDRRQLQRQQVGWLRGMMREGRGGTGRSETTREKMMKSGARCHRPPSRRAGGTQRDGGGGQVRREGAWPRAGVVHWLTVHRGGDQEGRLGQKRTNSDLVETRKLV